MAMLAEPRRKMRIGPNPQGTQFVQDECNVGRLLLAKMGWNPGQALGLECRQGIKEPIRLKYNTTTTGLGYEASKDKDPEGPHNQDFNKILGGLKPFKVNLAPEEEEEEAKEERKKKKKKRKHQEDVQIKIESEDGGANVVPDEEAEVVAKKKKRKRREERTDQDLKPQEDVEAIEHGDLLPERTMSDDGDSDGKKKKKKRKLKDSETLEDSNDLPLPVTNDLAEVCSESAVRKKKKKKHKDEIKVEVEETNENTKSDILVLQPEEDLKESRDKRKEIKERILSKLSARKKRLRLSPQEVSKMAQSFPGANLTALPGYSNY